MEKRATLGLGRWFGIPVGANIGVLVIIVLIGSGLAFGVLPSEYPEWSMASYLLVGLAAGLLLVLSIVVHELARALVARAKGVRIDGITLWLLGGVAQMRDEPASPRDELQISGVGPVTSLALGVILAALSGVVGLAGALAPVAATLGFLAWANVLLAVFNLLPAAPLDGGRVLRATLWWATGDRNRAATIADRAGRGLGLVLIGLGLAQALFLPGIAGLWLALIGLFMVHTAAVEGNQARMTTRLHGVRVRQVMSSALVTAPPRATVSDFVNEVVLHRPFSTFPLVDENGQLTGLVTLNRIRAVPAERRAATLLEQIACPPEEVPTAHADEPVTELLPRMHGCGDGRGRSWSTRPRGWSRWCRRAMWRDWPRRWICAPPARTHRGAPTSTGSRERLSRARRCHSCGDRGVARSAQRRTPSGVAPRTSETCQVACLMSTASASTRERGMRTSGPLMLMHPTTREPSPNTGAATVCMPGVRSQNDIANPSERTLDSSARSSCGSVTVAGVAGSIGFASTSALTSRGTNPRIAFPGAPSGSGIDKPSSV